MTLNDYRKQFKRNLMIIRTANGTSDASAGRTEDASDPVYENVDYAIVFLFNNRRRNFNTAEELEELVLELVRITNNGIISGQGLFGSGADSIRFHYVRSQDIAAFWYWFTRGLYWMLRSQYMEVEEIAAFCEYVINSTGYFFSDGCSIVSMLMSTYVFMRFDLPCPEYTSGEEYKAAAAREKIPTVSDLHRLAADSEFRRFVSYYLKICPSRKIGYNSFVERAGDGSYICKLTGQLSGERNRDFRQNIEAFYEEHSDACVIFDCRTLAWIDMEGISVLTDLRASGRQFVLRNLNADILVLLKVEGFEEYLDKNEKLRKIDLSGCPKINEGAAGIIYKVSDEIVAKMFKEEPDYYDLVKRRIAQKNALIAGVPAPFSFGYAEYDGKIVILMELLNAKSLLQIFSSEEDGDEYIVRYAQFVKQLHEIRDEEKLKYFERDLLGKEILGKADRCDLVLKEEHRGRARKIIEAIDEPECLVHGDIHPKNIMVSMDEMLFIDFDSFSTGKAVYDLGTLYRALLCNTTEGASDFNAFLGLPLGKCQRIWDVFIGEYYKDEQEEFIQRKISEAKLIGTVLALARLIRVEASHELISKWAEELEKVSEGRFF